MNVNPFTYGNPISDPQRFFGREREVGQVFSRLRNAEAESSSLVGERRVGKTSLLHHLKHPAVRQKYGVKADDFIFVYTDLQMISPDTTPTRLAQRLLRQLADSVPEGEVKQLAEELRALELIDNFALADLFDAVDAHGLHVVFLLDEFENVTTNTNFGPDFFYGLRSLAIQHNLTLITSSVSELIELTHSEAIRSSPFFNIFANINVRLFSREEAQGMITAYLENTGVRFSEGEVDEVFRLAGTHPFFLQVACHFLYEAHQKNLDPELRRQFLLKNYREEITAHLEDYWRNSTESEKIVLTAMALLNRQGKARDKTFSLGQLNELYSRSDQTLARLEKRALLQKRRDVYAIFNASFGDWIVREISNTMRDQSSYSEWLNSNRNQMDRLSSKARSEIEEILPKISAGYRELIIGWVSDPRNLFTVVNLLKGALR
ncbi:MAG: AAA family ATPase [Anaerolineales bacterium]|jgi:Cdc6-like AAA superfamily ATPase